MTCMWGSEGNLQEPVCSFWHVVLGLNSGHETWWQVPLLSEPKKCFCFFYLPLRCCLFSLYAKPGHEHNFTSPLQEH